MPSINSNIKTTSLAKFVFGAGPSESGFTKVTSEMLYDDNVGYGFVNEEIKKINERFSLPEIGDAFSLRPEFGDVHLINILMDDRGGTDNLKRAFCYSDKPDVPLIFKVKVSHNGNYNVTLIMGDQKECLNDITVFAQNRRYILNNASTKAGEFIECSFTVNVGDIFVRDKDKMYERNTIDISILGDKSCINSLIIEDAPETPTIYIIGDSTLTDQTATYPFDAATSYGGWAQALPQYFKQGIAVANYAHSGWTTDTPKEKGEWEFISKNLKLGDCLFIQFGHNDQKTKHLTPYEGYSDNLQFYIDEAKKSRAIPVIVTPLTRINLWDDDEKIKNYLKKYSEACIKVAKENNVALIDLNKISVEFMEKFGQDSAKLFYVPNDGTHTNDHGANEMAKIIYQEIKKVDLGVIADFMWDIPDDLMQAKLPLPSKIFTKTPQKKHLLSVENVEQLPKVTFIDIQSHWAKADIEFMAKLGIVTGDNGKFMPDNSITRAEFLALVLKAMKYPPNNVYNDLYSDVSGSDWYAGTIQTGADYKLIDEKMTPENKFAPNQPITREEMVSIIINSYKSAGKEFNELEGIEIYIDREDISPWAIEYVKCAKQLGIIEMFTCSIFQPKLIATRAQATVIIKGLLENLG